MKHPVGRSSGRCYLDRNLGAASGCICTIDGYSFAGNQQFGQEDNCFIGGRKIEGDGTAIGYIGNGLAKRSCAGIAVG